MAVGSVDAMTDAHPGGDELPPPTVQSHATFPQFETPGPDHGRWIAFYCAAFVGGFLLLVALLLVLA